MMGEEFRERAAVQHDARSMTNEPDMTSPRIPPGDAERLQIGDRAQAVVDDLFSDPSWDDLFSDPSWDDLFSDPSWDDLFKREVRNTVELAMLGVLDDIGADTANEFEARDATIADLRAQVAAKAAEIERLRARSIDDVEYQTLFFVIGAAAKTAPGVTVTISVQAFRDYINKALAASSPAAQPKNAGVAPDSDEPSTSPALRAAPLTGEGSVVSNQRVEANAPPRPISQPVEAPQPDDGSTEGKTPLWNLQEWRDEAEEWRGAHINSNAVEVLADDLEACFRDGVIAGKAEIAGKIVELENITEGEREARQKCESALRAKDRAMGVLFKRLSDAGIDCSDLIP